MTRRLGALLATAALLLATATACGSSDDNLTPSARGRPSRPPRTSTATTS